MVGLGLGLGLGLSPARVPAEPKFENNGGPEIMLQAQLVVTGDKTAGGYLVRAAAFPWLDIVEHLHRQPDFLFQFAQSPRRFEEFIAACYERAGFDEVILTPQRNDRGRDVIATKKGFGSIRFLEQVKAYSPGRLVTHNDVRATQGTLMGDFGASKGIITTTSDFEPGVRKEGSEFAPFMPHRLELKNGAETLQWIEAIRKGPE